MSEQDNIRVVQDAYKAFVERNVAGVLGALTDDVYWEVPGSDDVPFAGARHGKNAVGEFFRLLDEADDILEFEPQQYLTSGDTVVVLGHYRGLVKSTGTTNDFDWVQVFNVRDGKVSSFKQFFDTEKASKAYRSATIAR
jgi:ketosteroid isomerase-like protein